jgi:hypothetical protein
VKRIKPILAGYRVRHIVIRGAAYMIRRFIWAVYDPQEDETILVAQFEFCRLAKQDDVKIWEMIRTPQRIKGLVEEARREWT